MAYASAQTLFRYASTTGSGGTVNTTFGNLNEISLDGISVASIDVSDLNSTVKTTVCGTSDNGTITLSFMPDDTTYITILDPALYAAATFRKFDLRFGSAGAGTTVAFSGYPTSLNVTTGIDEAIKVDCTIRITGGLTWTG
jgi:hypothetical protein